MKQLKLKKGDCVLISLALIVAAIIYVAYALNQPADEVAQGESYAQIQLDGEIYKTVKLTKETQMIEIRTDRGYDILRVRDYGIEVVESDCPDKICFTYGLITKPNEEIICLPLHMLITIVSDGPSDPDPDELDAITS